MILCRWYKKQNNFKITNSRKAQLTIFTRLAHDSAQYAFLSTRFLTFSSVIQKIFFISQEFNTTPYRNC